MAYLEGEMDEQQKDMNKNIKKEIASVRIGE